MIDKLHDLYFVMFVFYQNAVLYILGEVSWTQIP